MQKFNYEELQKEATSLAIKELYQEYADNEIALRKLREYEKKVLC